MSALGIRPGDEVIVPAFLWVATITAVIQNNAIPVLCEVDDSLNMDAGDLEKKITERTKLIAVVHMAGTPCDMDAIMRVAERHNILVLEDCAQCNGGSFKGRKVGTFGKVGIYSLQINKNVTAGEGGLLVTDDERLYIRLVAAHDLGVPWKQGLPASDTGPFLILTFDRESRALRVTRHLRDSGIENVFHLSDYGLHIYHNIRSLVEKIPLSPAGNPWSLPQNADRVFEYGKGACPKSDDLFERSVIITIPSRLMVEQEREMTQAIGDAVVDIVTN